jgi:hypothetical protein
MFFPESLTIETKGSWDQRNSNEVANAN